MILGTCWMIKDGMKANTNEDKVFWDEFWGIENTDAPSSAYSMSIRDTIRDKAVLATLSGFQYQEIGKSCSLDVFKSDISSHLLSKVPQYIKNQDPPPQLYLANHWHQHSTQGQVQLL